MILAFPLMLWFDYFAASSLLISFRLASVAWVFRCKFIARVKAEWKAASSDIFVYWTRNYLWYCSRFALLSRWMRRALHYYVTQMILISCSYWYYRIVLLSLIDTTCMIPRVFCTNLSESESGCSERGCSVHSCFANFRKVWGTSRGSVSSRPKPTGRIATIQ
jgi:hypothetical protein